MQHYWNAITRYKFLLKNSSDPVIQSSASFDLKMVQDAVNMLSRAIVDSDEKGLTIILNNKQ